MSDLRPYQTLYNIAEKNGEKIIQNGLAFTEGEFEGIIFSYNDVHFDEDEYEHESVLKISFEYNVHKVPPEKENYNKTKFEEELGEFIIELLYYGIENDILGDFIKSPENEVPSRT